jgi:thiol-disulfide isomerase/thioredoxin
MAAPCTPLIFSLLCCSPSAAAQQISGELRFNERPATIALFATIGGGSQPLADAPVDERGRFSFGSLSLEAGFYELAVNDSDRVDLILGPNELEVRLAFTGRPLREHVTVEVSEENTLLFRYKAISRVHQNVLAAIRSERATASPGDSELLDRLAVRERKADAVMARELDALLREHPSSYFAFAVNADRRLMASLPLGIEAWRNAVDLCDRRLLRSDLFTKVVLGNLQLADDRPLEQVCDELLGECRSDSLVWTTMRAHLIQLFDANGPDPVAQYLVDRYVAGPDAAWPADQRTLPAFDDRLKRSIGAQVAADDPWLFRNGVLERSADVLARARLTLVFFFTCSCGHCHDQMPGVQALHQRYCADELQVIGVALDADSIAVDATLREAGLSFPVASSFRAWGEPLASAWGVSGTPSFFLLDNERRILAKPFDHVEAARDVELYLTGTTR